MRGACSVMRDGCAGGDCAMVGMAGCARKYDGGGWNMREEGSYTGCAYGGGKNGGVLQRVEYKGGREVTLDVNMGGGGIAPDGM